MFFQDIQYNMDCPQRAAISSGDLFFLDKKESSCDIYGFSFNCTQNSPVVQLLYMDLRKKFVATCR